MNKEADPTVVHRRQIFSITKNEYENILFFWDSLCLAVLCLYLFEISKTYYFTIIEDVLYFTDVSLRYALILFVVDKKGTLLKDEPISYQNNRFFFTWFVVDIFLSIPYGTLLMWSETLPALRLMHIKNSDKPIISFLTRRSFRQELIRTIREHLVLRKSLKNIYTYIDLTPYRFSLKLLVTEPVRRVGRMLGFFKRVSKKFQILSSFHSYYQEMLVILLVLRGVSFFLYRTQALLINPSSVTPEQQKNPTDKSAPS